MAAPSRRYNPLRPIGFLLLVAGWILAFSALILLKQQAARGAFVLAALAVEVIGLILIARSYAAPKPERN